MITKERVSLLKQAGFEIISFNDFKLVGLKPTGPIKNIDVLPDELTKKFRSLGNRFTIEKVNNQWICWLMSYFPLTLYVGNSLEAAIKAIQDFFEMEPYLPKFLNIHDLIAVLNDNLWIVQVINPQKIHIYRINTAVLYEFGLYDVIRTNPYSTNEKSAMNILFKDEKCYIKGIGANTELEVTSQQDLIQAVQATK